jgi:EAL domain-containing protein (putative c-di-GMP-specific phosphodiesterase class I)
MAGHGSRSIGRELVRRAARDAAGQLRPERLRLLYELRRGLERDEIVLHFQPKVAVTTDRVSGFEALVRWAHPARGLLFPASFLPAVERSPVMGALTRHVLRLALTEQAKWAKAGHPITVQVNLATRDLLDPDFPPAVAREMRRRATARFALGLEMTEHDILEDRATASATVQALAAMGVAVALDDFGTGYSSLSHLRALAFDELKVDRSFVCAMLEDRSSQSIVRATIDLSHDLGVKVVAEGVETRAVYDELERMGCDRVQGYWLARPMPAGEVLEWLQAREKRAGYAAPGVTRPDS